MNPATARINRSLLFIQALTAHIDRLRELLGEQWPEFRAQLQTVLDALEQAGEDQIPLYTTRLIEAGLKTTAADLVRALLMQVNVAANHPDSAARFLRLTDPTSGQSREVIVGKETETVMRGLGVTAVTNADILAASRKLILALHEADAAITGPEAYMLLDENGEVVEIESLAKTPKPTSERCITGPEAYMLLDESEEVVEIESLAKTPKPTPERRISVWISERPEGLQKPLRVGDAYTLNFKVGQPVRGTLVEGPDTAIPSSDVPDQGLETEWRITSQTVVLASLTPDTTVNTTSIDQNPVWTAHFSLHIPKEGESRTPQLKIIPTKARDARIDIVIYARREIYRQFTVELAVEESAADLEPQSTGVATVCYDIIHSPAGHLNLHTTHEWTTPPGELSIAVIGASAYVRGDAGPQYIDQITKWYGVQAAAAGRITNVRKTTERFRARWEAYLNDIDPDDLTTRLQRWSPDYDWVIPIDHADDAHRQQWETVSTSPERRALASDGHRLFEAFFPANSELRAWLDALQPGHRINISWQQTGGPGWIPHIPWGLMYRAEPPRAGEPVDPLEFLALRFRISYTPYETQGGKNLGGLQNSHQAYLLYWGTDPQDPAGAESNWQRQQWAAWPNRVYRQADPAPMAAGEAVVQTRRLLWNHYRNIGGLFYTYVSQYELFMAQDAELIALRT